MYCTGIYLTFRLCLISLVNLTVYNRWLVTTSQIYTIPVTSPHGISMITPSFMVLEVCIYLYFILGISRGKDGIWKDNIIENRAYKIEKRKQRGRNRFAKTIIRRVASVRNNTF